MYDMKKTLCGIILKYGCQTKTSGGVTPGVGVIMRTLRGGDGLDTCCHYQSLWGKCMNPNTRGETLSGGGSGKCCNAGLAPSLQGKLLS